MCKEELYLSKRKEGYMSDEKSKLSVFENGKWRKVGAITMANAIFYLCGVLAIVIVSFMAGYTNGKVAGLREGAEHKRDVAALEHKESEVAHKHTQELLHLMSEHMEGVFGSYLVGLNKIQSELKPVAIRCHCLKCGVQWPATVIPIKEGKWICPSCGKVSPFPKEDGRGK